ncbi:BLOC-1 related complex subunit 7 [Brevipalpus obovatus]|uniref:BLOC-1 related complex subunit 7 n=1 Tax=Brevipalpus obovatus TaxID=246614 RepID=UPI003D9EE7C9
MSQEGPGHRILFSEAKSRLGERIISNINNCGSLVRQVVRGSRSNEMLSQCLKNFVNHEASIENTQANINKIAVLNASILQPVEIKSD